jgi:hypothetical protein
MNPTTRCPILFFSSCFVIWKFYFALSNEERAMMVANDTFVAAVFAAVVDFLSLPAQPCVCARESDGCWSVQNKSAENLHLPQPLFADVITE